MNKIHYGVFNIANQWKVFKGIQRTGLFETRQQAMLAAESEVRAAMGAGFEVELYVESPGGELKRADLSSIPH
jgi:hypothetical protein